MAEHFESGANVPVPNPGIGMEGIVDGGGPRASEEPPSRPKISRGLDGEATPGAVAGQRSSCSSSLAAVAPGPASPVAAGAALGSGPVLSLETPTTVLEGLLDRKMAPCLSAVAEVKQQVRKRSEDIAKQAKEMAAIAKKVSLLESGRQPNPARFHTAPPPTDRSSSGLHFPPAQAFAQAASGIGGEGSAPGADHFRLHSPAASPWASPRGSERQDPWLQASHHGRPGGLGFEPPNNAPGQRGPQQQEEREEFIPDKLWVQGFMPFQEGTPITSRTDGLRKEDAGGYWSRLAAEVPRELSDIVHHVDHPFRSV